MGAQTTNERSRGLPLAGEVTRWPFTGKGMLAYSPSIVALRHWHWLEDEFVMVLEGEATLITDAGETVLGPGMAAGFPKGKADGHCLVNRGKSDVVYLEVGDRRPGDDVAYPDDDLAALWRDATSRARGLG